MIRRRLPIIAVFLLVVLVKGVPPDITMTFNKTVSEMSMKLFNDITIIDSMKNGFTCRWGNDSCYVECANATFSINFTENANLNKKNISALVAFNITAGLLECEITKCLIDPFISLLKTKTGPRHQEVRDLKTALNMKNMCCHLFNISEVKRAYIGVELNLIKVIMQISSDGEELIFNLTDLAVKVTKANLSSLSRTEKYMHIRAPLLSYEDIDCTPETWIPSKIFEKIPEEKRKVAVVSYRSPDHFVFNRERPQSMLIRVELLEEEYTQNLEDPLMMMFQILNSSAHQANHALECQFYDEQARSNNDWSKQGCKTTKNESGIFCTCDHMTPFTVLLVPTDSIDLASWEIQSIISYVGCSLSAFFTAAAILTHVILRSPTQDHSASIHVSLSAALFLLNISFLMNEWLANMRIMPLCMFISVFMHYGLLCSFTWMAIEALHLYLLIVRVLNIYIRSYVAKLAVVGWGVPAVVVGIAFAVRSEPNLFYGLEVITVGNSTSALCWITEPRYFYGLNLSYFALIFLFNNSILLTVSIRIFQMRRFEKKDSMTMPWKQACMVLGLTCLLGSTWGLAFLSYGALSVPMQYLFCIFNSLQGFLIFLWICRTSRKAKREAVSRTTS
ncbi:hypothetical protein COCON_G00109510 [Conger conger]|uniref:Uncharacterized protein n=1 Tax=Conger conger TaxID=82655 RepID=A0A9Q1DJB5_CONCO|nr:hypothetical protein COCON_G00109510 [Conger conger]